LNRLTAGVPGGRSVTAAADCWLAVVDSRFWPPVAVHLVLILLSGVLLLLTLGLEAPNGVRSTDLRIFVSNILFASKYFTGNVQDNIITMFFVSYNTNRINL
jgi:hypothetical protein